MQTGRPLVGARGRVEGRLRETLPRSPALYGRERASQPQTSCSCAMPCSVCTVHLLLRPVCECRLGDDDEQGRFERLSDCTAEHQWSPVQSGSEGVGRSPEGKGTPPPPPPPSAEEQRRIIDAMSAKRYPILVRSGPLHHTQYGVASLWRIVSV